MRQKYNISAYFLIPCLRIKISKNQSIFDSSSGFINSYIIFPGYEKKNIENFKLIFLLFNNNDKEISNSVNKVLTKNENFIEEILYEENTIYVFKVPSIFESDYELIKLGKYSKTSVFYKNLFPKKKETLMYQVLYRVPELVEKWSKEFGVEENDLPEDLYEKMKKSKETLNFRYEICI